MRTFQYKIKTTQSLKTKIENQLGCTRVVYNIALEAKEEAFRKGHHYSKFDLIKQLPDLKNSFEWLKDVHSQTFQCVIERLCKGYDKFFSDLKKGIKTSKPKFAKKRNWNSVEYKKKAIKYEGNSEIFISKIGRIKFFKSREIIGDIKVVKIIRKVDGYYLNVVTDDNYNNCDNQAIVGIDLGIKYFVVTSNGEYYENLKTLNKYLSQLRVENRKLSRKIKFSNNFYKQVSVIRRLHLKISRSRKDYIHKVSCKLVREYSTVVSEDLRVSKMILDKCYSRNISDVAWASFLDVLSYKTKLFKVNSSYSSQECNNCGYISQENRVKQDIFKCIKCSHSGNADVEAAITILNRL